MIPSIKEVYTMIIIKIRLETPPSSSYYSLEGGRGFSLLEIH